MEEYIYDSSNGLWYELHVEITTFLVCSHPGGRNPHLWYLGQKAPAVLIEHRSMVYTDLVLSGKLYSYLADIDTQAHKMIDLLMTQLAEKEGVHEGLKSTGSDGMGQSHEQHPQPSRRSSSTN